jgi:hypothetical protein
MHLFGAFVVFPVQDPCVDRSRGKICSSFQSKDLFFVLGQGHIKEMIVAAEASTPLTGFQIASCRRQPCVPGRFSGHCDLA